MTQPGGILVLGVGNTDRGDDGVGSEVARQVAELDLPGVRVVWPVEPVDLLDDDLAADLVVVVDAVRSGRPLGTVLVREVADRPLPTWTGAGGTHALGLAAAVELVRALGRMPRRMVVVGVEAEVFTPGTPLSPEVRAAVGAAAAAVSAVTSSDGSDL